MNSDHSKSFSQGINALLFVLTLSLFAVAAEAAQRMPKLPTDGWHTWRVAAGDDAPNWCCLDWQDGQASPRGCSLDSGQHNYSAVPWAATATRQMQIYAHMVRGAPTTLRALGTSCSVTADSTITDQGVVDADASVQWLSQWIAPRTTISTDVLAAIAIHTGGKAGDVLSQVARIDAHVENRKDAIFWMGQARARASATELNALMFGDPLPAIREHAAFSWSQSDISDRGDALRELAVKDADTGVRGIAWFWLAQTGDKLAERSIETALGVEQDRQVREQAIFALSQLPGDRGVLALIGVVENRRLPQIDRNRAIFWMAQSELDSAHNYLARILTD